MTKKKAQFRHAQRRAKQRYGLNLTASTYNAIKNRIVTNRSVPVKRKSSRITIHLVDYGDSTYKVVYDSLRHSIVTFLRQ